MEDQTPSSPRLNNQRNLEISRNHEPVIRSRWTPKPEQILILESIFNSGMVNPPKEETVKIRKLLEKFGSVGDANVFYWFQNRRSRSRRRQRQIQASLVSAGSLDQHQQQQQQQIVFQDAGYTGGAPGFVMQQPAGGGFLHESLTTLDAGCSSLNSNSRLGGADEIYFVSGQAASGYPEIEDNTSMPTSGSGVITVFINGAATEVEGGPLNMKGMFGEDMMLVHSSGVPVPQNEYGFSVAGLQHGESYYLVSRSI